MARADHALSDGAWLVEGISDEKSPLIVANSVVSSQGESPGMPIRVLNPSRESITVYRGTKISRVEGLCETETVIVGEIGQDADRITVVPDTPREKQELLRGVVENAGKDLTPHQRSQLYNLLLGYSDVFAGSSADLGRTGKLKHHIDTGTSAPIRQHPRRVPPARREEVSKLLKEMKDRDVIQPSTSPWASPVVLVRKKDGSLRFCVDYRKVNAITRKDAYPLPRIDDSLDALSRAKWFSTIDLLSGYWQVEMSEEDQEKTAFCTQDVLFEFKGMPFGLCNAPALMNLTLAGLQWSSCLVYMDDVVIVG